MSNQNLARLGELITRRRAMLGMSGTAALAAASGIGKRTIDGWLAGESEPQAANQAKLEAALHWRAGAIAALLGAEHPEAVALEDMAEPVPEPKATRASDLTDDELLVEVMHRLRDWRDAKPAPPSWTPAVVEDDPARDWHDLAADQNDEAKGDPEPGAPSEW